MCGIACSIGFRPKQKANKLFTELLKSTEVRGRHATGVAFLYDNEAAIYKAPIGAIELSKRKTFKDLMKNNNTVCIGHCRYATSGDPKENANNHPFISKSNRFVFVHNGRVGSLDKALNSKWGDSIQAKIESDTDSEYLLRAIEALFEDEGISVMKAIKDSVSLFPEAEASCVLLDVNTKTLYAWRNYVRPLWMFNATKLTGTHLITSTKAIFTDAMKKAGFNEKEVNSVKGYRLAPYKVYAITPDGCVSTSKIYLSSLGFKPKKSTNKRKVVDVDAYLKYLDGIEKSEKNRFKFSKVKATAYKDNAYIPDIDVPEADVTENEQFMEAVEDLSKLMLDENMPYDILDDLRQ